MGQQISAREMLEKLVSFPTVSSQSNLKIIEFVRNYLASHGVESHLVYDPSGQKANLYAHVGPKVEGGVILSGHTDVVPVEGQDWDSDPFKVIEKNGKLYGRGTCDMKGFDALALSAVPKALARGLKRPLQIALSYDEEIGCLGAPSMIEEMARLMPRAGAAIIGEPSMMQAVSGHKGGLGIATHIQGFEVHSSLQHTGVSAIHEAARLIDWANRMNTENATRAANGPPSAFVPPWTNAHVGMISGGTANNITAKDCRFTMGFRCIPTEQAADWEAAYRREVAKIEAAMQAVHPGCKITLEIEYDVPGLQPEQNGVAEALARKLTGDNGQHVVSYGTEAGQFQQGGYSAIICGPGSIEQAHQPNEFISIEQFNAGEVFMDRLIDHLAEE
ncbi:MAG: acetylornithine deacetylase [Alphaproteobacteria bacterium]|nr:acetylornithine deacetylase [Alphaproteobacteria bacterium]